MVCAGTRVTVVDTVVSAGPRGAADAATGSSGADVRVPLIHVVGVLREHPKNPAKISYGGGYFIIWIYERIPDEPRPQYHKPRQRGI